MVKNRFTVHLHWCISNRELDFYSDLITDFPYDRVESICRGMLTRLIKCGVPTVEVTEIPEWQEPVFPDFSPYKTVQSIMYDMLNVLGCSLENESC